MIIKRTKLKILASLLLIFSTASMKATWQETLALNLLPLAWVGTGIGAVYYANKSIQQKHNRWGDHEENAYRAGKYKILGALLFSLSLLPGLPIAYPLPVLREALAEGCALWSERLLSPFSIAAFTCFGTITAYRFFKNSIHSVNEEMADRMQEQELRVLSTLDFTTSNGLERLKSALLSGIRPSGGGLLSWTPADNPTDSLDTQCLHRLLKAYSQDPTNAVFSQINTIISSFLHYHHHYPYSEYPDAYSPHNLMEDTLQFLNKNAATLSTESIKAVIDLIAPHCTIQIRNNTFLLSAIETNIPEVVTHFYTHIPGPNRADQIAQALASPERYFLSNELPTPAQGARLIEITNFILQDYTLTTNQQKKDLCNVFIGLLPFANHRLLEHIDSKLGAGKHQELLKDQIKQFIKLSSSPQQLFQLLNKDKIFYYEKIITLCILLGLDLNFVNDRLRAEPPPDESLKELYAKVQLLRQLLITYKNNRIGTQKEVYAALTNEQQNEFKKMIQLRFTYVKTIEEQFMTALTLSELCDEQRPLTTVATLFTSQENGRNEIDLSRFMGYHPNINLRQIAATITRWAPLHGDSRTQQDLQDLL